MKKVNLVALITGTILFNLIFWKEEIALNFVLFSLFSILINYFNSPEIFTKRNVQLTTAGNLIACFFLLYHHSTISVIAALVSWIVMLGFMQQDELRTVHRALLSSIINFFKLPPVLSKINVNSEKFSQSRLERRIKLTLFPLTGLFVFYLIFREANSVFREMSDQFWHDVQWFFQTFFVEISGQRVAFFILGFMLCSWFIFKPIYVFFTANEKNKTDQLFRKRKVKKPLPKGYFPPPTKGLDTSLKTENRTGIIMISMISILLVFINILDIIYVWLGRDFDPKTDFSAEVHQGVNLLIFSIFLSIFIMIYYFRKNQNFYSKNRRLKQMAYFWIIQNFILIISVVFRNAHYINHHGLTHKRIGVFVFLFVVLLGLFSLFRKIDGTKSFFFLSRFNSWSLYGVLIFLACFNWDMLIYKHNFANRNSKTIDVTYLIDLSDEVILHLNKNRDTLEKDYKIDLDQLYGRSGYYSFKYRLRRIKRNYVEDSKTFFSWNYRRVKIYMIWTQVEIEFGKEII